MRASFIQEPELEFGAGTHIDIRFGLLNYGPLDSGSTVGPKRVRLGIVGTPESVAGLSSWINRCRDGILAKPSKRPNLFPRFPGFGQDGGMPTDIVLDDRLNRTIAPAQFDPLCRAAPTYETFAAIAQLYMQELQYLDDKREVDVCVCAYPSGLVDFLEQNTESPVDSEDEPRDTEARVPASVEWDLHDLLKAQAMRFGAPLQIVRPATYGGQRRARSKGTGVRERTLQDEATRAWNLYVALYYKAGGVPWRLVRDPSALACCYVGISFYKALKQPALLTSTAQVFNERGQGIILRGGPAHVSKQDRNVHLEPEDAYALLKSVLVTYQREHGNFPARVVVHKSSIHSPGEVEGFTRAMREFSVDPSLADFLSLSKSYTRLFRANRYPPLRGTLLDTGGEEFVLYTKGSVSFFEAYPGMYVPKPLLFRRDDAVQAPEFLATEILALSKMNWNNTQFDGGQPITLRASRQVGSILKYCEGPTQSSYRYYM